MRAVHTWLFWNIEIILHHEVLLILKNFFFRFTLFMTVQNWCILLLIHKTFIFAARILICILHPIVFSYMYRNGYTYSKVLIYINRRLQFFMINDEKNTNKMYKKLCENIINAIKIRGAFPRKRSDYGLTSPSKQMIFIYYGE